MLGTCLEVLHEPGVGRPGNMHITVFVLKVPVQNYKHFLVFFFPSVLVKGSTLLF